MEELPTAKPGMPGPLSGVRVIEIGDEKGEYCGLLLAGLGADVVKIEPLGGNSTRHIGPFLGDKPGLDRSLYFWYYNRGKRSVALSLSDPRDVQLLRNLLLTSDVLLDSTDSTAAESLVECGLDSEAVLKMNPRLVVARLTGFGDDGPWAGYKGSDLVHLALGGVTMNCGYDPEPSGTYDLPPIAPQAWHAFHITGEQAAIGIVAALVYRHRSGRGQYVSCAVHEAVSKNTELDLMNWVMLHQPMYRQTCRHAAVGPTAPSIVYTKDGRWFNTINLGARDANCLRPFMQRYGEEEGVSEKQEEETVGVRAIPGSTRRATAMVAVIQRLARQFRYDRFPWKEAQSAGLLWAPIRKPHENVLDEQWISRGTFAKITHPEQGIDCYYPVSKWISTRGSWTHGRRAPLLDEDREEVQRETRRAADILPSRHEGEVECRSPYDKPLSLEGIRVLDFTWFLASAGATRILAALGADVLKVEWKTHPDSGRGACVPEGGREARSRASGPMASTSDPEIGGQFNNKNPGKRGLSLNVEDPRGLAIAKALIAKCDVVAEGFSPGVLERWGLGYDVQRELNPNIIYVKQSGMGAFGEYGRFRAVGPIAAALSGISEMSGLPEPALPAGWGYSYLDWCGAYSMALAIVSAIRHRQMTGEGQWIDASQTEVGIFMCGIPVLDWSANKRAWARYGNRSPFKVAAPQGIYRCTGVDRWVAVSCFTEEEWSALARAAGHEEWLTDPRFETLEKRLANHAEVDIVVEKWTSQRGAYEVMCLLQDAGVAAGVCQNAEDRCDRDPQLKHLKWLTEVTGTKIGTWPLAELPFKMSETPPYVGGRFDRAAPLYGEDNYQVLSELLGMSRSEVDALKAEGVI